MFRHAFLPLPSAVADAPKAAFHILAALAAAECAAAASVAAAAPVAAAAVPAAAATDGARS
ncbi:hypothetical protein [Streptomyces sp. NPDC048248]|uniref:hypothetical protein n=1 Tax=Streptomyces sp. NPDC048248 TaxID=3365523 RepID=UPI003718BD2A